MIYTNDISKLIAWKSDDGDIAVSFYNDNTFQPTYVSLNVLDEKGRVCLYLPNSGWSGVNEYGEAEDSELVDYNKDNPKYESHANLIVEFDDECGYGKVIYTDMTEQDFNDTIDNFQKFSIIVKDKWEPTKQTHFLTPMGVFATTFEDCDGNEISVNKCISSYLPIVNSNYNRSYCIWFENGEFKCLVKTYDGSIN